MPRLDVLTNSALMAKRRCDERFRLKYLERLEPQGDRPALTIGSAVHKGIELLDPDAAGAYVREHVEPAWTSADADRVEFRVVVVEELTRGALAFWSEWPAIQEEVFEIPLRNPATGAPSTTHRLSGKWDGFWEQAVLDAPERGHGAVAIAPALLEIKTTTRLGEDYVRRLQLELQPTLYMAAASEKYGTTVRRAVYRIVKKPGIKPKRGESDVEYAARCDARAPLKPLKQRKTETETDYLERNRARERDRTPLARKVAETPDEYRERLRGDVESRPVFYFAEVVVSRTDEQLERMRAEIWEEHRRILAIERGEMTIRNTGSCLDFGRCDYFDLCTGAIGVESFNVREHAHPELED